MWRPAASVVEISCRFHHQRQGLLTYLLPTFSCHVFMLMSVSLSIRRAEELCQNAHEGRLWIGRGSGDVYTFARHIGSGCHLYTLSNWRKAKRIIYISLVRLRRARWLCIYCLKGQPYPSMSPEGRVYTVALSFYYYFISATIIFIYLPPPPPPPPPTSLKIPLWLKPLVPGEEK